MRGKTYLSKHRKEGWRYRRAVPRELVETVGKSEWSAYLGQIGKTQAEVRARALAARHDGLIARLKALSPDERRKVARDGGIGDAEAFVKGTDIGLVFVDHVANKTLRRDDEFRPESALAIVEAQDAAAQMRAEAEPVRRLLAKIDNPTGSSGSLQTLVDLWIKNPKNNRELSRLSVDKTRLYVARFVAEIGDIDPKDMRRSHALQFRDHLESRKGITRATGQKHLDALHRLFAVALNEGLVESNPFHKISVRRAVKADPPDTKPFDIEQVRAIFEALGKVKQTKYADDFRLLVRMLAYHGMRSGEAAHVRCEDVTTSMGVPILKLTEEAGPKKNDPSIREVPIHPAMLSEIKARAEKLQSGWLFPSFPGWKGRRGSWFQRSGGTFLRKVAKITDPALKMHSLRHTWRTLAREIDMPDAVACSIGGWKLGKGEHANYGTGPSLKVRAEWIAKIDPVG